MGSLDGTLLPSDIFQKLYPVQLMHNLQWTIYLFWTCLSISNPFASSSDTFAGSKHPEREYSCQRHPCQQWHYSHPQSGTLVHVILENAAVVAAGLCCRICDRTKEKYTSGQLGRDMMAKIYLVVTRSWQMFPAQQCLMFKISVSEASRRGVPLLLTDRRRVKAIAELCKMRPFLIAFLASRAGV